MAKGKILKKRDSDLISANVKPWVDIFWVTWWYWWLTVTQYPLSLSYSIYDNDNPSNWAESAVYSYFYDAWDRVICMWVMRVMIKPWTQRVSWYSVWYCEIIKSSLTMVNSSTYYFWTPFSWSGSVASAKTETISWVQRYWIDILASWVWWCYFNWTSLVSWVLANSLTTTTTFSLSWKTLSFSYVEFREENATYSTNIVWALMLNFT